MYDDDAMNVWGEITKRCLHRMWQMGEEREVEVESQSATRQDIWTICGDTKVACIRLRVITKMLVICLTCESFKPETAALNWPIDESCLQQFTEGSMGP